MNLLKNLFLIFCTAWIGGSCAKRSIDPWMGDTGKVKVVSTTAQIGDLVAEIGGERVDGWILIRGDLDPHSYELVKGDGEKFARADLIFYHGLGLEHGASLSALLRSSDKALALGEAIAQIEPNRILKRGDVIDPHIWMDISLWEKGIAPIVERLSAFDPEGASFYRLRGEALAEKMKQAHLEIQALLQKIPSEKRYLVTSHDAFHYFTRSYLADPGEENWKRRFAAPEGLAPDGQLNPVDLRNIVDFLSQWEISVLFPETNVSRDSIRKIASAGKELGLEVQICTEALCGDSMSGFSYLEMMRHNGKIIAKYLQ